MRCSSTLRARRMTVAVGGVIRQSPIGETSRQVETNRLLLGREGPAEGAESQREKRRRVVGKIGVLNTLRFAWRRRMLALVRSSVREQPMKCKPSESSRRVRARRPNAQERPVDLVLGREALAEVLEEDQIHRSSDRHSRRAAPWQRIGRGIRSTGRGRKAPVRSPAVPAVRRARA